MSPGPPKPPSLMPRAAVPAPKKAATKAPIPLRQKPLPPANKSKGVKPSTPSSKSPTANGVPTRARTIPKVKALTPAPSHDHNMALYQAHEALQRDYEALRHEHDVLLLKHNESVHSCLLLLEELKQMTQKKDEYKRELKDMRALVKHAAAAGRAAKAQADQGTMFTIIS